LVVAQFYYCHDGLVKKPSKKNQPKRPNQNDHGQTNLSKMTFWSNWTWGQKNHMESFLTKKFFVVKSS
jgi:hypothetical protein